MAKITRVVTSRIQRHITWYGNVSWQATYYPFGRLYEQTGSIKNNFRFPGQWYDEESEFFYNGARYYDPDTGRYLSPDPVIATPYFPQTLNPYVYVTNNSMRYVDESGRWGEDVHSGIGNEKYGTYKWAREVGFSPSEAKRIAIADNDVDKILATNWWPIIGDQSRHFNQPSTSFAIKKDTRDIWAYFELNRAIVSMNQGNCKVALSHIGKGLHSLQDKYAHRNWDTGLLQIMPHPAWYDDWNDSRNINASKTTEIETKKYLKRFIQLTR